MDLNTGKDLFFQDGSKRLHCRQWSKQGPTVILLHGAIANEAWWRPVASLLSAGEIYALDFSGHGLSDWDGPYDLNKHCQNIHAMIAELDLEPPFILVGHSYGGAVAARLKQALPTSTLVLVDTPMYLLFEEHKPSNNIYMKPVYQTEQAAIARFKPIPNQPILNQDLVNAIAQASLMKVDGGWTWQFDPTFHRRTLDQADQAIIRESCNNAWYVYGEYSPFATDHNLSLVADSGMRVHMIEGAYHGVPIDQPEQVAKWLDELISG